MGACQPAKIPSRRHLPGPSPRSKRAGGVADLLEALVSASLAWKRPLTVLFLSLKNSFIDKLCFVQHSLKRDLKGCPFEFQNGQNLLTSSPNLAVAILFT